MILSWRPVNISFYLSFVVGPSHEFLGGFERYRTMVHLNKNPNHNMLQEMFNKLPGSMQ